MPGGTHLDRKGHEAAPCRQTSLDCRAQIGVGWCVRKALGCRQGIWVILVPLHHSDPFPTYCGDQDAPILSHTVTDNLSQSPHVAAKITPTHLATSFDEDDSESIVGLRDITEKAPIALLKHLQGQNCSRKQHRSEREHGKAIHWRQYGPVRPGTSTEPGKATAVGQAAAPSVMPMEQTSLRRLWTYAEPHRGKLLRAVMWSVLNKAMDIAPPVLIGMAVDIVVNQEGAFLSRYGFETARSQLVVLTVLTFLIWGLESFFEYLLGLAWRNLAQTIQHGLRLDAYSHMQHLEMAFFEDQPTGNLMAILNDDVNQLERFLDNGASEVIQVLTTIVLIGGMFFVLAPTIAWVAFLPIPLILWGSFRFQKRMEPRYAGVRESAGAISSLLANNLGGIATIKAFTSEDRETARVAVESERYRQANRRAITLSAAFSPLIRVVILCGFTATLLWGGFLTLDGRLGVGAYSVMVFLTQRLLWPLTRLGQTFDLYQRAMASTNRILDVLDTPAEIVSGDGILERQEVKGHVEFRNVSFAYRPGYPVLTDIDLDLNPGATTAFVGATGSGKTTLIKLLYRLYDVDDGSIHIDGHAVRSLELHHLRQAMAVVGQDVFLFHGTVRDNIAYGKPDASPVDIQHAAEIAEAHRFIMDLPEQYDTIVGERGQKLSGGQRQRLSIARAVLVDPPILILDEATSSVDNETEAAIQRSLARLVIDRSTIIIAHRLSTIRHADIIYVMEGGEVIEWGTHEELLDRDCSYAALWRVQTGEAVE